MGEGGNGGGGSGGGERDTIREDLFEVFFWFFKQVGREGGEIVGTCVERMCASENGQQLLSRLENWVCMGDIIGCAWGILNPNEKSKKWCKNGFLSVFRLQHGVLRYVGRRQTHEKRCVKLFRDVSPN